MGHVLTVSLRLLLAATASAGLTAVAVAQDSAVALGKLAVPGCDFALDRQSGNLAAVDPQQDLVVLYKPEPAGPDKPLEPIARTKLRGMPVAIVYKQLGEKHYFVVGCMQEKALYLLNAADLKEEARIPIAEGCLCLATAASPRDPYAYYCYGNQSHSKSGVVNLESKRDLGEAFDQAWETVVSHEGNFVYTRPIHNRSGPRSLRRIPPSTPDGKPTFEVVFQSRDNHDLIVPDRFEERSACGVRLLSASLEEEIERMPMTVRAFFNDKPLAVGFNSQERVLDPSNKATDSDRGKLVVASLNSGIAAAKLTLPSVFMRHRSARVEGDDTNPTFKYVGHASRLFADDARSRIIVAWHDRLAAVKLADLRIPDEAYLEVDPVGEPAFVIGRKNVLALRPRDPRITIELAEPRGDMRMTPAGLEWTPPVGAIGEQVVKLRLRHGSIEKIQSLSVQVDHDAIRLPFEADRLAVSPDGKEAFVWTVPPIDRDNPFAPGADPNKNRPQGALIGTADGKVLAAGRLPFTPKAIAVDARHVYAGGDGRLVALDRATLEVKLETEVDGPIDFLELIDERTLVAASGRDRRLKFSVADLSLQLNYGARDTGGTSFQAYDSQFARNIEFGVRPVDDGWCVNGGDVFDRSFSRPILLENLPTFVPIRPLQSSMASLETLPVSGFPLQPWDDLGVFVVAAARLPELRATAAVIREIEQPGVDDGTRPLRKRADVYSLWLSDERVSILTGQPDRKIVLVRGVYAPKDGRFGSERPTPGGVVARGGTVYLTIVGKLFRIPAVAPAEAGAVVVVAGVGGPISPSSPSFDRRQSHLVIEGNGPVKFTHSVSGGVGPYSFSLTEPSAGFSIDAAGTVTLEPAQLISPALDRIVGTLDENGRHQGGRVFESPARVTSYLARNTPLFEQIAGRPPRGFPVTVVIGVQASDQTPRTARLAYHVLLEIPSEQVAARSQAVDEARRRDQTGRREPPPEQRFQSLEQRISQLEAQIESMKKLLEPKK